MTDLADRPVSNHLPITCPKCGRALRYVDSQGRFGTEPPPSRVTLYVCECPVHGIFHFDQQADLTEGLPPQSR